MKKGTLIIIVFVVVTIIFGFWFSQKSPDNTAEELNSKILRINKEYTEVLGSINVDAEHLVSFVIIERGNRNVYGDVVLSNRDISENKVLGQFNTAPEGFLKTVKIAGQQVMFTEMIGLGTQEVVTREVTLDMR